MTNETEVEPETAAPAVAPTPDGSQADGSPSPEDTRPTDEGAEGEGAEGTDKDQPLRQRLTTLGEEKKAVEHDRDQALLFAQRLLSDPKLGPQARAILEGKEPEDDTAEAEEEKALLRDLVGDGNEAKLDRLLSLREKRLEGRVSTKIQPLARTVVSGRESRAVVDALEGAGMDAKVARTPEFKAFQRDYERKNASWFPEAKARSADAMADLLVKEYAATQKRSTRDTTAARSASINRGGGGGAPAAAAAANGVEFDNRATNSFQRIREIIKNGGTPVAKYR